MAVRTAVLAHGTVTGSGVHIVYTAPAGFVTLLKGIALRNNSGATKDAAVGAASSGALSDTVDFVGAPAMANQTSQSFSGFWALNAGNALYVSLNSGGTFDYWLSGANLS